MFRRMEPPPSPAAARPGDTNLIEAVPDQRTAFEISKSLHQDESASFKEKRDFLREELAQPHGRGLNGMAVHLR